MRNDFFFTLRLTEVEHECVEELIREECLRLGIKVAYYRKFKTGHEPMYRECKLLCPPSQAKEILKKFEIVYGNYHAERKILKESG